MTTGAHNLPASRRFIAGAVCPRCSAMDKVVLHREADGQQRRECVACGYVEAMTEQGPAHELPTRVNQPRIGEQPLPHEAEVSAVKLIDPANLDVDGIDADKNQ